MLGKKKKGKEDIAEEPQPNIKRFTWLMFGAAEAGANTLSKVISLKYSKLTQEQRKAYTYILIDNIIESLGKLLNLLKEQHEASIDPRMRRYLSTVTRAYLFYQKIPDDQKKPKIFTRYVVNVSGNGGKKREIERSRESKNETMRKWEKWENGSGGARLTAIGLFTSRPSLYGNGSAMPCLVLEKRMRKYLRK